MPADESVPAELVADKYRLTRLLGRGGMGSVWEGVHTSLGTRVAIKFIDAEYANSTEARNRFENEARAAAKLRSKHVVKVFDHGLMHDGRPYIVMEFLDGEPLDSRLERLGRLPPPDTARILLQVCRALTNAHSVGIVHRDLKPENVFLVWDAEDQADVVKVVDFGIAKFTDGAPGLSSATRTGSVLGTPYYMSPEQARGLRSVDYRSDLWSLAVVAFRCVVGRLPFDGEAMGDLLVKICTAPLPVPSQIAPDVPPGFDAWFAKALQREPEARFQSAAELADGLLVACGASRSTVGSIAESTVQSVQQAGGMVTPGGPPWPQAQATPAQTAAPMTVSVKSAPKGVLLAVVLVTLGVLAIGLVVALRLFGAGTNTPEASATSEPSAAPAAAPSPPKSVMIAPEVVPVPPPPVPEASASAESAPSASAAPEPKPAVVAHRRTPHSRKPPRPAAPAATNKPSPKPSRDRPIDVGY